MDKLPFFIAPYPDEDFRSIIYRYGLRMGDDIFQANKELFGFKSSHMPLIPRNLNYFLERIPNISFDYFINNFTIIPLIKPFLPQSRLNQILSFIKSPNNTTYSGSQLLQRILSQQIKYCPLCIEEDVKTKGEVYVHRIHQPQFITVCSIHNHSLITNCSVCGVALSDKKTYLGDRKCKNNHRILPMKILVNIE